jgi:hypothetical protein
MISIDPWGMPGTLFAVPDTHDKDLENPAREDKVPHTEPTIAHTHNVRYG